MWDWLIADDLYKFYSEHLRSDFFNGFLSLAGFILAAKTFIVIHMKNEVYCTDVYKDRYKKIRAATGNNKSLYHPLEQMSCALFWVTTLSLSVAIFQVTFGLIKYNGIALFSVLLAFFACVSLVIGLYIIKKNLDDWISIINEIESKEEGENKKPIEEEEDQVE